MKNTLYLLNMTQQLHVAGLPQATEDGYFDRYRECKQVVGTSSWGSILRVSHLSNLTRTHHRPLSRRLDRCDRVIQNESRDPFGGNMYYVTMQITFLTRKFRNGERNLHCDVVHITTKWVFSLTLDCNGAFAIKAY